MTRSRRARARPRPFLSLVLVCLTLGLGYGLAVATTPAARGTAAGRAPRAIVPIERSVLACPDPTADKTSRTRLSLAAPGLISATGVSRGTDAAGAAGAGEAPLAWLRDLATPAGPVAPSTSPLPRLRAPGAASVEIGSTGRPVAGTAQGSLAPGLAGSLVTRTTGGDLRGLAGTVCAGSDSDFWFVGGGALVGQRGRLYLTNPEAAPAVADVILYGPDGPLEAPLGRGVTVAAGGQKVVLLDALSPGTTRFGVHVRVAQGRLSAALRDSVVRGLDPHGTDWVPAAAAPARRIVIPGVPGGTGARRLRVLAPGSADAIVKVRLLAPTGGFAPLGADVVQVPAGSVSDIDIARQVNRIDAAVELSSDVPVTAGLLARTTAATGQREEIAWTAAAAALTPERPGVVAEAGPGAGSATSRLTVAAPGAGATVVVTAMGPGLSPRSAETPQAVDVPADSQVTLDLSTVSTAPSFGVTVVPAAGSGPVVVSRIIEETSSSGRLLTVSTVPPGRFTVRVPDVVADVVTGLVTTTR